MKAILLLAFVFSTNAYAGSYYTTEYNQLKAEQAREANARAKNPQFFAALKAKSQLEDVVDDLTAKVERLERKKAGLCHEADYGDLISIEVKFERIQACKMTNRYTEDLAHLNSEIYKVDQDLNQAEGMLELKKQEVAFWQTRYKH